MLFSFLSHSCLLEHSDTISSGWTHELMKHQEVWQNKGTERQIWIAVPKAREIFQRGWEHALSFEPTLKSLHLLTTTERGTEKYHELPYQNAAGSHANFSNLCFSCSNANVTTDASRVNRNTHGTVGARGLWHTPQGIDILYFQTPPNHISCGGFEVTWRCSIFITCRWDSREFATGH